MNTFFYKKLLWVFAFVTMSAVSIAQDTTQYIVPNRRNDPKQFNKPYLILISADGFRHDLMEKYKATYLKQLSHNGVKAKSMQPCYPSLTFPNHYSIITGLYPSHHGIVDNNFYDPARKQFYSVRDKQAVNDSSWYGGEPLWVLAEKQKMLSASFYWVGSESHIDGVSPTYYFNYNEAIPIDKRMEILKEWLQKPDETRPHFITFYFPEVDHQEHLHGVDSKETEQAVHFIDTSVHKIVEMCHQTHLPINFIFVSDHGFANLDTLKTIALPSVIDTSKFIITGGGELVHLYAKNKSDIRPVFAALKNVEMNYTAYLTTKTPKEWHYNKKEDKYNRIGDIILVPSPPYSFYFGGKKSLGGHGFDNRLPEMQASFYAWGPAFKQHLETNNFSNIDLYPLIARILQLKIDQPVDGKIHPLKKILKR